MSDDIKSMMEPPPAQAAPPFVTAQLAGNQLKIASNIPNGFVQIGLLASALVGLILQGANQEQPSRIIKLS